MNLFEKPEPPPVLRPYQTKAIEDARAAVASGVRCFILVCATGGGKTVIAGSMIQNCVKNHGGRVLFIVNRLELVNQTVYQLSRWGVDAGVIRADDERTDSSKPVQVGTIQTLLRRDLPDFDLVFVDEAHLSASDGWRLVIGKYKEATIVGMTATPVRFDQKPLGDLFETLVQVSSYSELIALGNLVAPICYRAQSQVDLSGIHTLGGDYVIDELVTAMTQVSGDVVREWRARAEERRTVVFACTIDHSKDLVARFVEAGVVAEHLDGTTPETERAAILARLDSGTTKVVSNVGVLHTGWDQPSAKCIVLARPTQSLSLAIQMCGRIMRPWQGVTPIIIDHSKVLETHGLPHEDRVWSLTDKARAKIKSKFRTCPKCFAYVLKNPCEQCGWQTPVQHREIREDKSVQMVQHQAGDERRSFFLAQVAKSKANGFKPGFAAAKFKERYGAWPPWAWSEEAKRAFADDSSWQDRQVSRERERAYWKNKEENTLEVDVEPERDNVVSFNDWVQRHLGND